MHPLKLNKSTWKISRSVRLISIIASFPHQLNFNLDGFFNVSKCAKIVQYFPPRCNASSHMRAMLFIPCVVIIMNYCRRRRDAPMVEWVEPGSDQPWLWPATHSGGGCAWWWSTWGRTHHKNRWQAVHPVQILDYGQVTTEEAGEDQLPAHQEAVQGQGAALRGPGLPSQ